ncbi:hypothetical protein ACP70R_005331 [Stipagrostis hirtigluma subsp. patula]
MASAGVIPKSHPWLAALCHSRQSHRCSGFLRDLISVLYVVEPMVLNDLAGRDRSVLLDGVRPTTSPKDLLDSFPLLRACVAVVVRDSRTGFHVGFVVFGSISDATSAANMVARPEFYSTLFLAVADIGFLDMGIPIFYM